MNAKWRGDRNRLLVSLVKSELQTFINYDLDCRRFYAFALAEPKLLQAAASNEKNVWKNKAKKASRRLSLVCRLEMQCRRRVLRVELELRAFFF